MEVHLEEMNEEVQNALYSALEELAFFLKQCSMNGSFRCNSVRDIIRLATAQERPHVNTYIMPVASCCVPMLLGFLAEGSLPTMEDNLLCAEAAAGLLSMFPQPQALTIISHCFEQLSNEPNSYVDFSQGKTAICLKLLVACPLRFKLCLARGFLRCPYGLTCTVLSFLAEPITTACYQYSSLTCLGFRTLHMWLLHWEKMEYCLSSTTAQNIYSIVANNWENPIPGVRKDNTRVLSILLDVSCPTTKFTAKAVFEHVMTNLSWKMKSKYFALSVLIPKIGVVKAMQQYPCIVPALVATLGINRLNYAGADVYRVCLADLPSAETWCHWFLQPVWAVMTSKNDQHRLAQIHFLSHWLTPTIRSLPGLAQTLHELLTPVQSNNLKVDLPLSALLYQGRKIGHLTELWPEHILVERFLEHADEEVRKYAFGAVCKKTRKTAIPPSEEFEAVKMFLTQNVNADSATLRQSLVDSFIYFLERLHESSVRIAIAKKKEQYVCLMPTFTFLQWLHNFLLKNLETGGNYQRKVTSLQLYLEVLKCFGPGKTKSAKEPDHVRLLAKQLYMWSFESESSWNSMVECILSPTDDIQKGAGQIMANHLKLLNVEGAVNRAEKLWQLALQQCCSALFYEAESGSILMKLIAQFTKELPVLAKIIPPIPKEVRNGECVDLLLDAFNGFCVGTETGSSESSTCETVEDTLDQNYDVQKAPSTQSSIGDNNALIGSAGPTETEWLNDGQNTDNTKHHLALKPLLAYMHYELQRQWDAAEQDLFKAVTSGSPLHGVLAAFSVLVPYCSQYDVARLLFILGKIIDHYLGVLSGQSKNMVSPSFSEMTQAIDNMIPEDETEGFSTQLSPSHQLVLSCVWLTLKECCNLTALILCHSESSGLDAVRCLILVERILLRCRYKGSIEAAGNALAVMVRHVTSPKETRRCISSFVPGCGEKLSDFLQDILLDVLRGVTIYSNKTSITQRSAGVGILVQKIVAADSRPDKPLLQFCLRKLCETVETHPPDDHAVEECDLPQASALHLLCRLVQDSSLRQEMTPFASTIALLCFEAFSSPVWTVQNAALQLFGVLVPLLVGEKKVHDDDVETFGNITTEEFFSHHPSILAFILNEMEKHASRRGHAKEIVPILSFLSKLTLGDSLSVDNCNTEIQDLQRYLNIFMKNSALDVRKIAAKCYSRFIPKELLHLSVNDLLKELNGSHMLSDDEKHGVLATIFHLVNRLVEEGADAKTFESVHKIFQVTSLSETPWICNMTALDVMQKLDEHCINGCKRDYISFVKFVLHCLEKFSFNGMVPAGVNSWATQCVDFTLQMCSDKELCSIWSMLYTSDWDEHSDVCLYRIRKRVSLLPTPVIEELVNTLMSCVSSGWNKDWELLSSIYQTLLVMIPFMKLITSSRIIITIFKNARKDYGVQCWSVTLPLVCEMIASHIRNFDIIPQKDVEFVKLLALDTLSRTSADDCAVETRLYGAKAFVILFRELSFLHSQKPEIENVSCYTEIVDIVLNSGIALLQDEDGTVRVEASKIMVPEVNPYVCLMSLLCVDGLSNILSRLQIARYFQKKLLDFSSYEALLAQYESKSKSTVSCSPFGVGTSNIYAEERHILQFMADSFLNLLQDNLLLCVGVSSLPEEESVRDLVTRLLQVWKPTQEGAVAITSDMHSLLVRLHVLEKMSEKTPIDSSSKDYSSIKSLVSSTLQIC